MYKKIVREIYHKKSEVKNTFCINFLLKCSLNKSLSEFHLPHTKEIVYEWHQQF